MEGTDHSIRNAVMTVIWAHGQVNNQIEHFYPPDEIKYHAQNRGVIALNFFGSLQLLFPTITRPPRTHAFSSSSRHWYAEWLGGIKLLLQFQIFLNCVWSYDMTKSGLVCV